MIFRFLESGMRALVLVLIALIAYAIIEYVVDVFRGGKE